MGNFRPLGTGPANPFAAIDTDASGGGGRARAGTMSLVPASSATSVRSVATRGLSRFFVLAVLTGATMSGCAEELPDHIELRPAGVEVDIAVDVPTSDAYKLVGQVTGMAAAHDLDVAHDAAKNDLRNKAAALGATLVTIDEDTGEGIPLLDKTRVKLVGRAYKPID